MSESLSCDHCGRVTDCVLAPSPYINKRWPDDPDESSWWCDRCMAAEQAEADAYEPTRVPDNGDSTL